MTTLRFGFQTEQVRRALAELPGVALNVGANDDPADLKALDCDRVLNCDLFDTDRVLDRPNRVDVLFDCARDTWPFQDRSCAIVVLGDILEHLKPGEIVAALREARRVSARLAITVPEDHRDDVSDLRADQFPRGAVHRTTVTEPLLRGLLENTGWNVISWETVEYDNGVFWGRRTDGHFVSCN